MAILYSTIDLIACQHFELLQHPIDPIRLPLMLYPLCRESQSKICFPTVSSNESH